MRISDRPLAFFARSENTEISLALEAHRSRPRRTRPRCHAASPYPRSRRKIPGVRSATKHRNGAIEIECRILMSCYFNENTNFNRRAACWCPATLPNIAGIN